VCQRQAKGVGGTWQPIGQRFDGSVDLSPAASANAGFIARAAGDEDTYGAAPNMLSGTQVPSAVVPSFAAPILLSTTTRLPPQIPRTSSSVDVDVSLGRYAPPLSRGYPRLLCRRQHGADDAPPPPPRPTFNEGPVVFRQAMCNAQPCPPHSPEETANIVLRYLTEGLPQRRCRNKFAQGVSSDEEGAKSLDDAATTAASSDQPPRSLGERSSDSGAGEEEEDGQEARSHHGRPKAAADLEDTAGHMPSIGSRAHAWRQCKPCAFHMKDGAACRNDAECRFCHLCGPNEKKQRRKERKLMLMARNHRCH